MSEPILLRPTIDPDSRDPAKAFEREAVEAAEFGFVDDRTHSQIAHHVLRELAQEHHAIAPVAVEGKLWCYRESLWRAQPQLLDLIGQRYAQEKRCKKRSDYRAIVDHSLEIAEEPGFFLDAEPGIVTPSAFWRATIEGPVSEPLRPEHRARFALPVEPDFEAPRPFLDHFLRMAFQGPEYEAKVLRFGELAGAVVTGELPRLQRVALFLGKGNSAKSTAAKIISHMIEPANRGATSPHRWDGEYYVAALAGLRLNVVAELSQTQPIPAAIFKQVTGGDPLQGRHPNHRPFTFYNSAAHLFISNFLPVTEDRSDAFFRRWEIFAFENQLSGAEVEFDYQDVVLEKELPQLLAMALAGASRLKQQGGFTPTPSHARLMDKWRRAASSVLEFLFDEEACELGTGNSCKQVTLHYAYEKWCHQAGRKAIGRNTFYEEIDANGHVAGVSRKRTSYGEFAYGVKTFIDWGGLDGSETRASIGE
jgi:putative DNA primase/helicase